MGTLIEMLANKKRAPAPEATLVLPMATKPHDHEGACGEGCGCGDEAGGGCCSS